VSVSTDVVTGGATVWVSVSVFVTVAGACVSPVTCPPPPDE
jgi:hypothetical protein